MTLPKLTPSQWRSLASGTVAIAITVNSAWLQIAGTPGIHIPLLLTAFMQAVGVLVAMGSRSLNKRDSGTGTGVVGDPACPVSVVPLGPASDIPAASAPPLAPGLMPSLIAALAPVGKMLLTAYAADLVARQHQQAATDATVQIDQSALLAAHVKLDAVNASVAALAVPDAQTPALAAETPTEAISAPPAGAAALDAPTTAVPGGMQ